MLNKIIEIVKEAGKIYKNAKNGFKIEQKGSNVNLVTEYDKKIQDFFFQNYPRLCRTHIF